MNKQDKERIIVLCILILIAIPIFVIAGEYKKLVVSLLSIFITGGIFFLFSLFFNDYEKEFRKSKKYYSLIKNKENKNVFDEFYMLTFQNKAERLFREKLNTKKVKSISNLGINTKKTNHINISFDYNLYSVSILLSDHKIIYRIDTPYEYDHLEDNKEFEKKNTIDISIETFKTLDDYLDIIINLINNLKNDIDCFTKEHNINKFINGNIFKKYNRTISYIKTEGLICSIFCLFILIVFTYVAFIELNNSNEGIIGFICSILISVFCIFPIINGVKKLYKIFLMKQDINKIRVTSIKEVPYKVKIVRDSLTKQNHNYIVYLKLYYKDITLYVLLKDSIHINNSHNIKEALSECLKIKQEVKYLSKSKIVILGGERYISIIKDYLN